MSSLASFLEWSLLELKQLDFLSFQLLACIKRYNICPLEHLPAPDDLISTLVKEQKLSCRVLLHLVQQLHIVLVFCFLLFTNFFWFLMVVVSLVMKLILQNIVFWVLSYLLLRFKLLIWFFKVLIDVTRVVPTGIWRMLGPFCET